MMKPAQIFALPCRSNFGIYMPIHAVGAGRTREPLYSLSLFHAKLDFV